MRRMRSLSVSPSTYSNTMYGRPSSSPASITPTMCGWDSWATARASRRKRSSWSESVATSRFINLIATWRWRVSSVARYTVDIPPAPIRASSRYRPLSVVPSSVLMCSPVFSTDGGGVVESGGLAPRGGRPCVLLHRSGVPVVMGARAGDAQAFLPARRQHLHPVPDVRDGTRVRRSRRADRRVAGGGRKQRDARRSQAVAPGPPAQLAPGVYRRQGRSRAGRPGSVSASAARGLAVPPAQAGLHRGVGG